MKYLLREFCFRIFKMILYSCCNLKDEIEKNYRNMTLVSMNKMKIKDMSMFIVNVCAFPKLINATLN